MASQHDPGLNRLRRVAAHAISSFRTVEPSVPDQNHPLRKLLSRLATFIAKRPTPSIVVSVAIGTVFSYLFVLLYASAPPGAPGLLSRGPGEWTTSAIRHSEDVTVDVELRQVWVYGSSMRALDKAVLEEGLKVQNALLGNAPGCTLPELSGEAGGAEPGPRVTLHSPLIYWNCSSPSLQADADVISTISSHSHSHSPFNVTLSPSSVFGNTKKSFDGTIIAADALVVSLLYPRGSKHVEDIWLRGARALSRSGSYDTYPSSGGSVNTAQGTLYEFRSQPAATRARLLALAVAYGAIAVYMLFHLGKIRALKSRLGIAVAAITQTCVSILAASAVTPFLNNLNDSRWLGSSGIPREAYPLVVLVAGLDNAFLLVKAVSKSPSENPPTSRIAKALGDIGYIILTAIAQNFILLYLLAKVISSPDVTDFCVFVAVAITIDFIMYMTFFIAVLSVDLKRRGFGDSLDGDGSSERTMEGFYLNGHGEMTKPRLGHGPSLLASVFRVRTFGTVAIVCFVMMMHRGFISGETSFSDRRLAEAIPSVETTKPAAASVGPILQVGRPATWLESQNRVTVKELARATGLQPHRFVVRVHEPLLLYTKGANRTPPPRDFLSQPHSPSLILHLLTYHFQQITLYTALMSAIAGLLVNHLLHGAADDPSDAIDSKRPQIAVQNLSQGHSVDVVMLAASAKGVLVSVGLDRRILVWHLRGGKPTFESVTSIFHGANASKRRLWPIEAIALDDQAEWLAICPQSGAISFYHIPSKQFGNSPYLECSHSKVLTIFFMPRTHSETTTRFVLVRNSGLMTEAEISNKLDTVVAAVDHQISPTNTAHSLTSSQPLHSSRMPLRLVSTTREGGMYVSTKRGGRTWVSEVIDWPKTVIAEGVRDVEFVPVRALGIMGLMRSSASPDVHLLDVQLSAIICRFRLHSPKPHTLRTLHSPRQPCRSCGASAVSSFSIAYTSLDTGEFFMHTYTPNATQADRGYLICLRAERDPREKRCMGFEKASERVSRVEVNRGAWEGTLFNSVVGVRQKVATGMKGSRGDGYYQSGLGSYGIVRRKSNGVAQQRRNYSPHSEDEDDEWEAWTMSSTGEVVIRPLSEPPAAPDGATVSSNLLVTRAGPACPIGKKSVAIAFGDTIKVVLLGTEMYDDVDDDDVSQLALGRRPLATRKVHAAIK